MAQGIGIEKISEPGDHARAARSGSRQEAAGVLGIVAAGVVPVTFACVVLRREPALMVGFLVLLVASATVGLGRKHSRGGPGRRGNPR